MKTLDEMLAEVVRLLNEGEHMEALQVVRKYYDIRNVWCCVRCGQESSTYELARGCPACGGNMETRVVRGPDGSAPVGLAGKGEQG